MQLPVYVQDGADRGEPLLLYVLLGTLVVVHLWNTYLDWRQHRMYHPSVRIPDALEAALKAVDAQAKDHDQRNGSGEGEEGKEHGDDDARKAADKDGDESDEEEIEVGKLWPTTVDKFVKSQAVRAWMRVLCMYATLKPPCCSADPLSAFLFSSLGCSTGAPSRRSAFFNPPSPC